LRYYWGGPRQLALCGLLLAATGCLVDEQRCDAHQVELQGDFALCVCEPNAVFNASGAGCTPCGANELASNGACECAEGFSRSSPDAGCLASGAGAACGAATPCGADYPYCAMTSASEGYCSRSGCAGNADCTSGWTCERAGDTRFCRRPPTGLGVACTGSADCASFEASYCEAFSTHTCILQGCALKTVSCPNEWACCDFSSLLGAPLSICAAPAMLTGGSCPMGGVRVTP
jgi:hypothetical protein